MEQLSTTDAHGLDLAVITRCPECGDQQHVWVNREDYTVWRSGVGMINEILPYLSVDDREALMTGICSPCWDKTFKDLEDE